MPFSSKEKKCILAVLAGLAGVRAAPACDSLVARGEASAQASCCSSIEAYGGPGGYLGQLGDGQNRIGDKSLPHGQYCFKNGGLIDEEGRGCILTPPTTQFQCDVGAAPTLGFTLSCNGTLSHDGSDTFWSCATGDKGGFNIYSKPISGEPSCTPIWLQMSGPGCQSGCIKTSTTTAECSSTWSPPPPPPTWTAPPPPPKWSAPPPPPKWSAPPPPPPKWSAPAPPPPPPKASCPAELPAGFQFPHLIMHVDNHEADKCYGNSFNGTASGSISSIFNFDVPASYAGKQCTLQFLWPTQDQLETSSYEFSGPGRFDWAVLDGAANEQTTYANAPKPIHDFGTFNMKPGSATTIGKCPEGCPAGKTVSFWMSAKDGSSLNYFQDSNPCPIGIYMTAQ